MTRARISQAALIICSLLFLPGRLVEEGLHTLAALPWASWVRVEIDPEHGTAETRVQFRDGTPDWAIRAAHLLPEAVAAVAGAAVIAWWLLGGAVWWPVSVLDWVLLSVFGAQYLALVIPSAADADHTPTQEGKA
jgi:hypothetical protein